MTRGNIAGLSEAEKKKIGGICLSAQGGSIFAANEKGEPLTPAYTWMDRRAESESEEFAAACGREKVRGICGWGPSPADCVSKILWIRRNQPDVYSRARRYYTTEESVTGYLTDQKSFDFSGIIKYNNYKSGRSPDPALRAVISRGYRPNGRACPRKNKKENQTDMKKTLSVIMALLFAVLLLATSCAEKKPGRQDLSQLRRMLLRVTGTYDEL